MQARAGLTAPSKEEVQHFLQKQLQIIASNVGTDPTAGYLDYNSLLHHKGGVVVLQLAKEENLEQYIFYPQEDGQLQITRAELVRKPGTGFFSDFTGMIEIDSWEKIGATAYAYKEDALQKIELDTDEVLGLLFPDARLDEARIPPEDDPRYYAQAIVDPKHNEPELREEEYDGDGNRRGGGGGGTNIIPITIIKAPYRPFSFGSSLPASMYLRNSSTHHFFGWSYGSRFGGGGGFSGGGGGSYSGNGDYGGGSGTDEDPYRIGKVVCRPARFEELTGNMWQILSLYTKISLLPNIADLIDAKGQGLGGDSYNKEDPDKKKEKEKKKPCNNFENRIKQVINTEGGFVNDPTDRGGATNKGIAWKTWKENSKSVLGVEPTLDNLKKLTDKQAKNIYRHKFWDAISADKINDGDVRYLLFDFGVNSGKGNAIRVLQKVLNTMGKRLAVDGGMGTNTLKAMNNVNQLELYNKLKQARIDFIENITKRRPKQKKFLKGWLNRVKKFKDKSEDHKYNVNCD